MSPLFGPNPDTVLAQGKPTQGTITGIRVSYTHDDPPRRVDEYAITVGTTIYAVRQQLSPEGAVRLGMVVPLRVDGSVAVIDWGDVTTHGWKSPAKAPAPGIDDDSDGLGAARKKWMPATITLSAITERSVMFGMASVRDVTVTVEPSGQPPYETVLKKLQPAHYAAHLFAPGTVVSGWANPSRLDRVLIDWAASAVASPGVGSHAAVPSKTGGLFGGGASGAMSADTKPTSASEQPAVELPGFIKKFGFTSTSSGEIDDAVSFETFVAIFKATNSGAIQGAEADTIAQQHGVAAGDWDAAQARWMGRIAKDMTLGIAFGQALNG